MVLSRNKKNNVYPCKPQFYYIKVGFKGGQNCIGMFSWWNVSTESKCTDQALRMRRMSLNFCTFHMLEDHYENTPIQIYRKFHLQKLKIFRYKNLRYFSYSCSKHRLRYSLEPPRRGGSNEYPQSMFWAEIWKIMYNPVNPSFTI